MKKLIFSTKTDAGDIRGNNEDSIFAKTFEGDGHSIGLFAVADGCGGLDSGEEISSLIVIRLSAIFDGIISGVIKSDGYLPEKISLLLDAELRRFNSEITGYFRDKGQHAGSTLSLLLIIDRKFTIKNIGDSRVYLCRRQKLKLLTEDQSVSADLMRSGELTQDQAQKHHGSNVLTMCIGMFDELEISTSFGTFSDRDRFLICSDGLYKAVEEKQIEKLLGSNASGIASAAELLRGAIPSGRASDNVSVIVCGYEENEGLLERLKARLKRK